MRSAEEVRLVLSLVEDGLNDCEIARRTGIPRKTILGWRHGRIPRHTKLGAPAACPRCGHPEHEFDRLPQAEYAYLLGLYLGDGFIATHARVYRLTIYLDRRHQGIVIECKNAMRTVMPRSKASILRRRGEQTDEVHAYSRAWPCLFPQHGPGKKHLRTIELATWQREIVQKHPQALIRGLIHSDGSYSVNTIRHPKKTYVYPRYLFSNESNEIRLIFCEACDQLGIEWRTMNAKTISIAQRDSIAAMDEFVGPKE